MHTIFRFLGVSAVRSGAWNTHSILLVVLLSSVGSETSVAQIPGGWIITSHFYSCESAAPTNGLINAMSPDGTENVSIDGLPTDLTFSCTGSARGPGSIVIRPEDSALVVGEGTGEGSVLEVFLLELDGAFVARTTRYEVGVVEPGWEGEVVQLAFVESDLIVFGEFGVRPVIDSRPWGIGLIDLNAPSEDAVSLFPVGIPNLINAVAVDPLSKSVIIGSVAGPSSSSVYRISVETLLETEPGSDLEPYMEDPIGLLFGVMQVAVKFDGTVVIGGGGTQSGLYAVSPGTSSAVRFCTDVPESQMDVNAMTLDPNTGEVVVWYGGLWNRTSYDEYVTRVDDSAGGCTVELIRQLSPAEHGIASGIAIVPRTSRSFLRGDCNDDGAVDISDASCILGWLFLGDAEPGCVAATGTNGDAAADLSDAVYLLTYLFLGGPAPAAPFPDCGPTPEDEALPCDTPPTSCQ